MKDVLSDIRRLKRDQAVKYSRKNDVHPFQAGAEASLQFFCERTDCALFCLANHSKKRPHNIVLGRTFDAQLLDMIELGVLEHAPISSFSGATKLIANSKVRLSTTMPLNTHSLRTLSKLSTRAHVSPLQPDSALLAPSGPHAMLTKVLVQPVFVFLGEEFTTDGVHKQLKSLLVDMFQGSPALDVNVMGVRRVMVCSAHAQGRVSLRHYAIELKSTGSKVCIMSMHCSLGSLPGVSIDSGQSKQLFDRWLADASRGVGRSRPASPPGNPESAEGTRRSNEGGSQACPKEP